MFLWKSHAENVHQKLVPYPFLILVNNLKQPLHVRYSFKNHTHVKKVGHIPTISVWHLLMNLKNNFLLKKTVEVGQ